MLEGFGHSTLRDLERVIWVSVKPVTSVTAQQYVLRQCVQQCLRCMREGLCEWGDRSVVAEVYDPVPFCEPAQSTGRRAGAGARVVAGSAGAEAGGRVCEE
eukprot:CAMPEP_0173172386 /NCGR_PEP_ID=MMETSP1141-20130122/2280_1 /TAXON_ID=483371 /ORGANISM="non described non described, Strain CCMP2298" /LENGTH=100 /DNA_ID=CAMNT_0014094417 /DNA_START=177 /DNA_END=480 /DNA_ORIENTATION=+